MADDIKLFGAQRELFPKHQFLVQIETGWSSAFQKCSELSQEIAVIEYYEGGSMIPWKVPGRVKFADITLERGACTSRKMYDWAMLCANASLGAHPTRGVGAVGLAYRKEAKIIQLDRDGQVSNSPRTWRVMNCWISKFIAGDWDNTADEVVIEKMTICYDFFELVK